MKIKEKEFGPNHMSVAVSLNDLAQLYYLEGRFAEAEPLYRRALGILAEIERVHPLTSAVLFNNVAELFAAQGRSVGAVMPKLASRMEAEEAAAEAAAQATEETVVALAAEIVPPEPRVSLAPEEDTAAPAAEVAPVVPRPPE
ncbi:MAG: tetratricopeptide repeat protein, partial [Alphaproteobacteria bacterium]|nr:tetratricopeptide repeat protein [Alphaproteobacteria bacterium]